jgi:hypothetical protein
MNYKEATEATIQALGNLGLSEQMILILKDLYNDDYEEIDDEKNRTIEEKLEDLRKRYDKEGVPFPMNLFPSEHKGSCQPFCLAIANKRFNDIFKGLNLGFRGLMQRLTAYWFNCLNVNNTTLILTSAWDEKAFKKQHEKVIDSYTRVHNKTVIIIEVGQTRPFLRYPY